MRVQLERIKNFFSSFESGTRALFRTYSPTTHLTLYYSTKISWIFAEFRNDPILVDIIALVEVKFNKCFQNSPYLFYFSTIIDLHTKLNGMEYLVTEFHKKYGL